MGGRTMKKLKEVPESALLAIQSDHQRAMAQMQDRLPIATIPTREVSMRIDRPTQTRTTLESVIVPKIIVTYQGRPGDEGHYYNRNGLSYYLDGGDQPLPYGHIYSSSGTVCLGSIFVPSKISLHTPAQPLEALFLHNDHNVNHGGARVIISSEKMPGAIAILDNGGVLLSPDAKQTLIPEVNVIKNDALWIVSADAVNQLPMDRALYTMQKFFDYIFNPKNQRRY